MSDSHRRRWAPPVCAACGAAARRASALFCATCGCSLGGGYRPTDALRASYHRHYRVAARPPGRVMRTGNAIRPSSSMAENYNRASFTALAFVTYSLVPYLGILFCPGAIILGGVGLWRSQRLPRQDGRVRSSYALALGVLILCVQLLLWWMLYKVPQWSGPGALSI